MPTFALVGALDARADALYLILLLTNGDVTGATNHKGLTVLGILLVVLAAIWVLAWFAARSAGSISTSSRTNCRRSNAPHPAQT